MDEWYEWDLDGTIRDFDFTKRAVKNMHTIVNSAEFEDLDANIVFRYLRQGLDAVSFKDYLRRYLYETAGLTEKYAEVGDEVYQDIIRDAFRENYAPYSFTPTTKKRSAIIKGWLSQNCVKRQTIFLLGFGLRMSAKDVSGFLLKVQREQDFNFYDKYETIYWFCYRNQLRYAKAQSLLDIYDTLPPETGFFHGEPIQAIALQAKNHLTDEEELLHYLSWLKATKIYDDNQDRARRSFQALFAKAQEAAARVYQQDEEEKRGKKQWTPDEISAGDIEKMLYAGIPVDKQGNLWKMSLSLLKDRFSQYRLTRQRMDSLLKGKAQPERFDLITLAFFYYAQWDTDPKERSGEYMRHTNAILEGCGMNKIYPAHPYEAFILLCLLSDCPLGIYADIWEMSYQPET